MINFPYATKEYHQKIEVGLIYQNLVTLELLAQGFNVNPLYSRAANIAIGESASGLEIKYDRRVHGENGKPPTHRVYIETGEKKEYEDGTLSTDFIDSGTLSHDNSWLIGVGDTQMIWVFSKKRLRALYNRRDEPGFFKKHDLVYIQKDTMRGFTMPQAFADKTVDKKYLFKYQTEETRKLRDLLRKALDEENRNNGVDRF